MNIGTVRLLSQLGAFVLFFIVPVLDLFRLDLSQLRFYLFQRSFPFSEGYIFLLSVLLLVFVFVGISKWFGRQFCGWLCPHNTFSVNLAKLIGSRFFKGKKFLQKSVDLFLSILFAPIISFSMLAYFYNPHELLNEIVFFQYKNWSFDVYLFLCIFFFVMINRLRSNFCRSACPYGMLQMILSDKNSKMGNVRNLFSGTGLVLLVIVISLVSLLSYSVFSTKGFSISVQKQLQGVKNGNEFLYSYSISLENSRNQDQKYHLQLEGVPAKWQVEYPSEISIQAQGTRLETILFHIDQESLNQNYSLVLHIRSDSESQLDHKLTIFPTVR
ncbi:MAG TPA: 4Fe-4S binding protein [Bacillota bacterium]|nr:4Fe-4S binding protein [Bacillota bacterium]